MPFNCLSNVGQALRYHNPLASVNFARFDRMFRHAICNVFVNKMKWRAHAKNGPRSYLLAAGGAIYYDQVTQIISLRPRSRAKN
jgi:hypothetical protein